MNIPDKLYFKIGEVARLVGVEPHVLRYWQTEFREIAPIKSRSHQRLYRRRDVDRILKIKNLLYEEGYTLSGARRRLRHLRRNGHSRATVTQLPLSFVRPSEDQGLAHQVRRELEEILRFLGP